MSATGMIYALVSRGHETVLSSYSAFAGNFPSVALDVLFFFKIGPSQMQFAENVWTVRNYELQLLYFCEGGFCFSSHGRHHCNNSLM